MEYGEKGDKGNILLMSSQIGNQIRGIQST
jgi:hypothetical protein